MVWGGGVARFRVCSFRVRGFRASATLSLLGGSWVVIGGVISRVTILINHIKGLIALLITTHEPPSITGGFADLESFNEP